MTVVQAGNGGRRIRLHQHFWLYMEVGVGTMSVYVHMCAWAHMWKLEDNLKESVPSFHHVGPGKQSQVPDLLVLSPVPGQLFLFVYF